MPSTKPDLHIDQDGVCNACRAYESRKHVDWDARRRELLALLEKYRRPDGNWDCIVPVSGGKDSTYQVIRTIANDAQVKIDNTTVTQTKS